MDIAEKEGKNKGAGIRGGGEETRWEKRLGGGERERDRQRERGGGGGSVDIKTDQHTDRKRWKHRMPKMKIRRELIRQRPLKMIGTGDFPSSLKSQE